jgi:uncharacterized membrane protein
MVHTHLLRAVTFCAVLATALVVRLLPFRPPNVEPVMAAMMPFAKHYGPWGGFAFGALSIVLFDLLTLRVGLWTLITAFAYGLVGIVAHRMLAGRQRSRARYVGVAILGTLIYDGLTGLTIGPLLWGQSFTVALAGQVPFTLLHLSGSILFAVALSPALDRLVAYLDRLDTVAVPQKRVA